MGIVLTPVMTNKKERVELMLRLLIVVLMLSIQTASASGPDNHSLGCRVGDETIAVGETRWVHDPALLDVIESRDWQGYRVICRNTASLSNNNGALGSVITLGQPVLVLTEISDEFYEFVVGGAFEDRKPQ